MPLDYVAEYNLAGGFQYGASYAINDKGFVATSAQTDADLRWATSHDNNQSGYYNWWSCMGIYNAYANPNTKSLFEDAFFTTGEGKGYHMPSVWEWMGVSNYYNIQFIFTDNHTHLTDKSNFNEAIEFAGTKNTYAADYYSTGTNFIGYALRFKRGTGNPSDGLVSIPVADFPLAPDNSMACAYRYQGIGVNYYFPPREPHLKVQCVYVGDQNPLPDLKTVIAKETWWNAKIAAGEVVTRIFPLSGFVYDPGNPSSTTGKLIHAGSYGWYWSSTKKSSYESYYVALDKSSTLPRYENHLQYAFTIRPFANP